MPQKLKQNTSPLSTGYTESLVKKATKAEKHFKRLLKECGVEFIFQYAVNAPGSFYILDFYLPKSQTVFEIDGKYHNEPEQVEKDRRRDAYLSDKGCTVKRLANEEVFKLTSDDLFKEGIVPFIDLPSEASVKKIKILEYREPGFQLSARPRKPKKRGRMNWSKKSGKKKQKKVKYPQYKAYDPVLENKRRREEIQARRNLSLPPTLEPV